MINKKRQIAKKLQIATKSQGWPSGSMDKIDLELFYIVDEKGKILGDISGTSLKAQLRKFDYTIIDYDYRIPDKPSADNE